MARASIRHIAAAIAVWLLLTQGIAAARAEEERAKRVLIISTGSRLAPGFILVDRLILDALRGLKVRTETYAENLDVIRLRPERSQQVFNEYLHAKYEKTPPDVVILVFVGHLGATVSVLEQLFPNTPLVVAGLTEEELDTRRFGPLTGGFAQRQNPGATLALMLRLHPGLRRIVIVGGTADVDRQAMQRARLAAEAFRDRVSIEIWDRMPVEALRRDAVRLPPDSAILFTRMFTDGAGQAVISAEVGQWLGRFANVPVYTLTDTALGTGAVGGAVASVEATGRRAGDIAAGILDGRLSGALHVEVRDDTVPMFDSRALRRWRIGDDALPAGSVVRFKSPSLWTEYGGYIAAALAVIVLQSATIVALFLERRQRRRIEAGRARAELELQQQRSELAHGGRVSLMGELAASLAHELSQPLTAIFANAKAVLLYLQRGEGNSADAREAVEELLKDQVRAADVVRHMRGFVRKDDAVAHTALDLGEIVRDVAALVRSDAALHRTEVVCDVEAALPHVSGNRTQLQQVLLNLLLNALDAMTEATGARTVTMTARALAGVNQVAVSDRGRGLPVDDTERVFEPFYTTKREGLGMGLSICRSIIRAHGGRLWAENNGEGGATFCFTVPVAKA